jgi:hypothetical protein
MERNSQKWKSSFPTGEKLSKLMTINSELESTLSDWRSSPPIGEYLTKLMITCSNPRFYHIGESVSSPFFLLAGFLM